MKGRIAKQILPEGMKPEIRHVPNRKLTFRSVCWPVESFDVGLSLNVA